MASITDHQQWLDRLWALHSGPVFAYAARRVGRDRAEDVVADTFVVAWRHCEQRPNQDLPWLLGVARRVIGESYRADERWLRLQDRVAANGPVVEAVDTTRAMAAREALASLEEPEREVLLLSAWEGLSSRQAASVLGTSPAAYRMRLGRARRHLRRSMADVGLTDATAEEA
ncbi:MAG TPA: sigma-70 family RNA polymerase sigma factor [Acidimicrobiia bacterium]|nr:sigma-70 family RNA polymerase sigma factor [Acidimicrobiia bacterium]